MKIKLSALLLLTLFTNLKPSEITQELSQRVFKVIFSVERTLNEVQNPITDEEKSCLEFIFKQINAIAKSEKITCHLYKGFLIIVYKKQQMTVSECELQMNQLLKKYNCKNIKYNLFTTPYE
ncbi:MAG: hypothetical protein P4L22_01160 [Candidatus Babeliales bacterium]|nr:hypothetical protein [Candidatus Babeliales bacterium]